jgi:hypothetical protein
MATGIADPKSSVQDENGEEGVRQPSVIDLLLGHIRAAGSEGCYISDLWERNVANRFEIARGLAALMKIGAIQYKGPARVAMTFEALKHLARRDR